MKNMIVGSDGCLIRTQSKLISGWEKCDDLKVLKAYAKPLPDGFQDGLKWIGAKIPVELMRRMWATMKEFPHREIGFMLYINSESGEWYVKCPPQRGSGGSVFMEDKGEGVPDGFAWIGTVHTHPNMGAFWSGTDQNDQKAKYGLHFVFGLDDGVPKRWKVTIFTPRASYDQEILDVVEALPDDQNLGEPVKEWLEVLNKPLPESAERQRCNVAWSTPMSPSMASALLTKPTLSIPSGSYSDPSRERRALMTDVFREGWEEVLKAHIDSLFGLLDMCEDSFPELMISDLLVEQMYNHGWQDAVMQSLMEIQSDDGWSSAELRRAYDMQLAEGQDKYPPNDADDDLWDVGCRKASKC